MFRMSEDSARAVELRDYLDVLWRRKWVILIAVVVVCATGVFRSARQTKVYRATGQILVSVEGTTDNIITQLSIIQGQAIREKVVAQVPGAAGVSASGGQGRIVSLSVESPDPKLAAVAVQAYIATYIEYRQEQRLQQLLQSTEQTRKRADELKAQVDELTAQYEEKTAEIDGRAVAVPGESAPEAAARLASVARERRELDITVKSPATRSFATSSSSKAPCSSSKPDSPR